MSGFNVRDMIFKSNVKPYFKTIGVVGSHMYFDINERPIILTPLESVPRIAMLIVIPFWSSTVREQNHNLMD